MLCPFENNILTGEEQGFTYLLTIGWKSVMLSCIVHFGKKERNIMFDPRNIMFVQRNIMFVQRNIIFVQRIIKFFQKESSGSFDRM